MKYQLEDARRFLAAVVPWPDEERGGYVNIHSRINKEQPIWFGRATQDLNDAINAVGWALSSKEPTDLYFCTSLQSTFTEKTSRAGKKYKAAERHLETAVCLRSFWFDVDYGSAGHKDESNGYISEKEAITALASFIKYTGFPKPSFVVKTGGGLHVYWTVTTPIAAEEWRAYAYALAEAGKQAGLKADYNATVDAARILRVPQTLNHKLNQPRDVVLSLPKPGVEAAIYSNDRILKCLDPYKVALPVTPKSNFDRSIFTPTDVGAIQARYHGSALEELGEGIEHEKKDLDEVAKECGFIRDALATGGRDYNQPLWNLTTLVATFTAGGRDDAHRMSNAHPDYTQESTDALYDRKSNEQTSRNLGYPSCKAIAAAGSSHCRTCPHFAKGKSPLSLSALPQLVPPTALSQATPLKVGDLPEGYVRRDDNVVCLKFTNENGTDELMPIGLRSMEEPFIVREAKPIGDVLHFKSRIRGEIQDIELPCKEVNTHFQKMTLQSQGFMVPTHKGAAEALSGFLVAWVKHLQETKDMVQPAVYGWTMMNGTVGGFSYANKQFSPIRTTEVSIKETDFTQIFRPQGDAAPWYDAWRLVSGRPDLETIVATAFASPLMHFVGHNGVTLSAYSTETGAGKSTALETALAVWGQPKGGKFKTDDTQNAATNKIGQLRNLPAYWDEIKTHEQFKKFLTMAFDLTLGVEKSRLRRDATIQKSGNWQTILTVCSNDSLVGYVGAHNNMNEAGVVRIFEYEVQKLAQGDDRLIDLTTATQTAAALNDNHGHLGLTYAEYLGRNYAHVKEEVTEAGKLLEVELKPDQDERYWMHLIAILLTGAKLAVDLNLVPFDLPTMKTFLFEKFEEMRQRRKEIAATIKSRTNIADLLAQFLAAHSRNILWTDNLPVNAPGRQAQNAKATRDTTKLDGVLIQIAENPQVLRIAQSAIRDWCKRTNKVLPHPFIKGMKDQFGATSIKQTLGAGTPYRTLQQPVIDIALANHPELNVFN